MVSNGWKPEILLKTLNAQDTPPPYTHTHTHTHTHTEMILPKMLVVLRL